MKVLRFICCLVILTAKVTLFAEMTKLMPAGALENPE